MLEGKMFDRVQFYCRDPRVLLGIPPRDLSEIPPPKNFTYERIHADTQRRKAEIIKAFRLASLRGC